MGGLLSDFRHALRSLLARPGFLATAVLTIALGVGANTAIFSLLNAVLLRPLPYQDPERLLIIWQTRPDGQDNFVSGRNFLAWRREAKSFSSIAAIGASYYNITGDGAAEQVSAGRLTPELFPLLGVAPLFGRNLAPEEEDLDKFRVVLLSYGLWQRRYGGRRDLLGQSIILSGIPHTIIGVMPREFYLISPELAIWVPLDPRRGRDNHTMEVIARLKPGITRAQAAAEMAALARRMEEESPLTNRRWGVRVVPLREELVKSVRPALLSLQGTVLLLLLITCANVANLLLARAAGRRREMAMRAALGATRWRLARFTLAESLLLGAFGGIVGLAAARAAMSLLVATSPGNIPRLEEVRIDAAVLVCALAGAILVSLLFGLAPAWQAWKQDLLDSLRESGRGAAGGFRRSRSRTLLLGAQIALSLMLLAGAVLFLSSFQYLHRLDRGFRPDGLLTLRVSLPSLRYPTPAQSAAQCRAMVAALGALPGVLSASASTGMPLDGHRTLGMDFTVPGRTPPSGGERPAAATHLVSPGYFATVGTPILEGRPFTAEDRAGGKLVAIVSESLARQYWPDQSAVGKSLRVGSPGRSAPSEPEREVIGVARDIRYPTGKAGESIEIYMPYDQNTWPYLYFFLRTAGDPSRLIPAAIGAIRELDADLPVSSIETMEDRLARLTGRSRWNSLLITLLALTAVLIAAVGTYGVVSYTAAQQVREIGVRMAMGALPGDIFRLVVQQTFLVCGIGVAAGLVGYAVLAQLASGAVYGVQPADPRIAIAAAFGIALATLAAAWIPARRATRVAPASVLRAE